MVHESKKRLKMYTVYPFNNEDSYKFSWSIDDENKKININLDVATMGWAAIALTVNLKCQMLI